MQVIRALLDWPLGSTALLPSAAMMYNMLGEAEGEAGLEAARATMARAYATPGARVHWYGKAGCSVKRKIGHVNITAGTRSEACRRLDAVAPGARFATPCSALIIPPEADLGRFLRWCAGVSELLAQASQGSMPAEVAIVMGSDSDLPNMAPAARVLQDFGVPCSVSVVSAHRTPERMFEFARTAHLQGCKVRRKPPSPCAVCNINAHLVMSRPRTEGSFHSTHKEHESTGLCDRS